MMNKGKLIVIEGSADGVGKSTQFALLREYLVSQGSIPVSHHFPSYGKSYAAPVEAYLKGEYGDIKKLNPYFINSLYAVDRVAAFETELKTHYENGGVVLLDRYTTSSIIYQSAFMEKTEKDTFISYVTDYEYNKLGLPMPDVVIFLDVSRSCAEAMRKARLSNEGVENDVHEASVDFMSRVWESAQYVCDRLLWKRIRCNDGDKLRSVEDIHGDIVKAVSEVL